MVKIHANKSRFYKEPVTHLPTIFQLPSGPKDWLQPVSDLFGTLSQSGLLRRSLSQTQDFVEGQNTLRELETKSRSIKFSSHIILSGQTKMCLSGWYTSKLFVYPLWCNHPSLSQGMSTCLCILRTKGCYLPLKQHEGPPRYIIFFLI